MSKKIVDYSLLKDDFGRFRTQSLFFETKSPVNQDKYPPIFTTKDDDHTYNGITYLSLKKIYLSYDHIPGYEYEFAMDVFNSWDHWVRLAEESIIRKHIVQWRLELDIRIKAEAIKAMMAASREGDAKGVNAAKYLAEKGYNPARGRPSKEEIERERKVAAGVHKDLEDDMERLGLQVIQGNK